MFRSKVDAPRAVMPPQELRNERPSRQHELQHGDGVPDFFDPWMTRFYVPQCHMESSSLLCNWVCAEDIV